jgi:hypothetical protein
MFTTARKHYSRSVLADDPRTRAMIANGVNPRDHDHQTEFESVFWSPRLRQLFKDEFNLIELETIGDGTCGFSTIAAFSKLSKTCHKDKSGLDLKKEYIIACCAVYLGKASSSVRTRLLTAFKSQGFTHEIIPEILVNTISENSNIAQEGLNEQGLKLTNQVFNRFTDEGVERELDTNELVPAAIAII